MYRSTPFIQLKFKYVGRAYNRTTKLYYIIRSLYLQYSYYSKLFLSQNGPSDGGYTLHWTWLAWWQSTMDSVLLYRGVCISIVISTHFINLKKCITWLTMWTPTAKKENKKSSKKYVWWFSIRFSRFKIMLLYLWIWRLHNEIRAVALCATKGWIW